MLKRIAIVCVCLLGAASAVAQELGPEQARAVATVVVVEVGRKALRPIMSLRGLLR